MAARQVYGVNPVRELIKKRADDVVVVYLLEGETGPALHALRAELATRKVPVEQRSRAELDLIAGDGSRHQGVIAVAGEYPYSTTADMLKRAADAGEPALILALDGVQDPHNLGALVRSAHVLGAHGVIVPKDRAAQVTPAVVKTSAGATEHMAIAQVVNLTRALEELKQEGLWIAGACFDDGQGQGKARASRIQQPWEVDLTGPVALVIGAEGKGIRPLVERTCDLRIEIPMVAGVSSLNAAAAGAVLLYEARRQRLGKGTAVAGGGDEEGGDEEGGED
ncbi:MAG: 23S rRNA (guanosine(2251)-2'-O)-methyltransferase RlmB [Deltaproteobacteria bacterium]|nr:23S rRNA (guanosine(2251)-2'-O)-methyltransferase RlmB [Deltaproteobacteria bacterium]